MGLLLVRRIAILAGVRPKPEMDIVPMTPQPVGEVEDLITIRARVTSLIEMGGNVMFRTIALFCERFTTFLALELLDLKMNNTMMFTSGARIAKGPAALIAGNILTFSFLRFEGLADFLTGHDDVLRCVFGTGCCLRRGDRGRDGSVAKEGCRSEKVIYTSCRGWLRGEEGGKVLAIQGGCRCWVEQKIDAHFAGSAYSFAVFVDSDHVEQGSLGVWAIDGWDLDVGDESESSERECAGNRRGIVSLRGGLLIIYGWLCWFRFGLVWLKNRANWFEDASSRLECIIRVKKRIWRQCLKATSSAVAWTIRST